MYGYIVLLCIRYADVADHFILRLSVRGCRCDNDNIRKFC